MDCHTSVNDSLAIDGGAPVRTTPLPPWPIFDEEQIDAVARVLRSGKVNYWTGQQGRRFEEEFAEYVGCRHAVAVANGTVALELALHALGIGEGDEVVVPSRSFIASASCCLMRACVPVFAEVDPVSQNITAETVRAVLGPRTKAILVVHMGGWPCDMDSIVDLARRRGLKVIEDCAQAHGATYRGQTVGSFGDAAAFSFCQDKILSTGGEGGMLTTNNATVRERAWSFKDHGKSWEAVQQQDSSGVFRWVHESVGTNWRMTEMQAAIGRMILPKLDRWLELRRAGAAILDDRLGGLPGVRTTLPPAHVEHSYYRYHAFVRPRCLRPGWSRDRIVRALRAEGIPCGSGLCPEIYMEKAFDHPALRPARRHPVARQLGRTSVMLPVHPTLGLRDVLDISTAIEKVLAAATADRTDAVGRAA